MRGKRVLTLGLAGGLITFLLCGGIGTCIVTRSWQSLPTATVTVGRDTTYLDGPLDEQGFVDYFAALNQEMAKDVAPEENAAVLLLQAFGPPFGDAEFRSEFYRLLGVEPLPAEGDYFVESESIQGLEDTAVIADSNETREVSIDPEALIAAKEKFRQDYEEARSRPWFAGEFPVLARWIEVNEIPLELILQASRRPKCYLPLVPLNNEDGLMSASSGLVQPIQDAIRLLSVRATLRVGKGQLDEAWTDLLAGHQLARHVSQVPMVVDGMRSIAMEAILLPSHMVLIHDGEPTPELIAQMLADLAMLRPPRAMDDRINTGDRFQTLGSVANLSRQMTFKLEELGLSRDSEIGRKVLTLAGRTAVDWDEILRIANAYYDRLHEALDQPSFLARREAVTAIHAAMEAERDQVRGFTRVARSFVAFRSPKKTLAIPIANVLVALLSPATDDAFDSEGGAIARRRMLRIALGAAAYHAEYGVYPESLDGLGDYLPDLPVDPFSERSFHYRLGGDGFVLHSVGPNGKDEQGRNSDIGGSSPADDIGLYVPPMPPCPQED